MAPRHRHLSAYCLLQEAMARYLPNLHHCRDAHNLRLHPLRRNARFPSLYFLCKWSIFDDYDLLRLSLKRISVDRMRVF